MRAGLALYLAALLWLTLAAFPDLGTARGVNLEPGRTIVACARIGGLLFVRNVVGNVVAFVPLGIALRAGVVGPPRRLRGALAAGAGFSLFIEVMQYRGGVRVADVDDVILNAAGALAGALLVDLAGVVAALARDRGVAADGRVG
jgi:glycopeptide antibiotics resistance protein